MSPHSMAVSTNYLDALISGSSYVVNVLTDGVFLMNHCISTF